MARRHGQHGALFVDISTGANGLASRVATITEHSRSFETAKSDVTAYEDPNTVFVSGKPHVGGAYKGFADTASDQLYFAATDGRPRKFYDYLDTVNDPTKYYFGMGIFDMTIQQTVDGPIEVSGSWEAAGAVSRNLASWG